MVEPVRNEDLPLSEEEKTKCQMELAARGLYVSKKFMSRYIGKEIK